MPDVKDRACFSTFWTTNHQRKKTWLGLVISWTRSWVRTNRNAEWDREAWHAWAVASVLDRSSRRQLIIYDCDPCPINNLRPGHFLIGVQVEFIAVSRREQSQNIPIWYNQDDRLGGQERCLDHAWAWLEKVNQMGDLTFLGEDDPRVEGCQLVVKK